MARTSVLNHGTSNGLNLIKLCRKLDDIVRINIGLQLPFRFFKVVRPRSNFFKTSLPKVIEVWTF